LAAASKSTNKLLDRVALKAWTEETRVENCGKELSTMVFFALSLGTLNLVGAELTVKGWSAGIGSDDTPHRADRDSPFYKFTKT
jgi:hypothetical protein